MDFFNWVSTGDNYKSSFQSSWSANAKRRKRQQAEALRAEADRMARAAHAARAEAAEAAAAAVRARRGSWTGSAGGQRPGSARGAAARAKSGKKTIDGFDPVSQVIYSYGRMSAAAPLCSLSHSFVRFVSLLPFFSHRNWSIGGCLGEPRARGQGHRSERLWEGFRGSGKRRRKSLCVWGG